MIINQNWLLLILQTVTHISKKSCIQEKMNLSKCADSSNNYYVSCVRCHMSCVMCHMFRVACHLSHVPCHLSLVTCHLSPVTCYLLPVTCHMSPMPTATAKYPPPANSPTMYSRLVHQDRTKTPKKNQPPQKNSNCPKIKPSSSKPILAIHSWPSGLQSTGKHGFQGEMTHRHCNLYTQYA